jgi:hypothetical protein
MKTFKVILEAYGFEVSFFYKASSRGTAWTEIKEVYPDSEIKHLIYIED